MRSKLRRSCAVHFARPLLHAHSSRFGVSASCSLTRTSILHGPPPDVLFCFPSGFVAGSVSRKKYTHISQARDISYGVSLQFVSRGLNQVVSTSIYLKKRSLTSVLSPVIRARSLSLAPRHSHIYVTDFFRTTWRLFSPCPSLLWSS